MKFKSTNLPFKFCLLVIALIFGARTHAATIDLVLTEYNSDTLGLSGNDAANWTISGSGDQWTATRAPLPNIAYGDGFASWTEPDDPTEINAIEMEYYNGSSVRPLLASEMTLYISSDQDVTSDDNPVANGTPVLLTFYDANGSPIPYSMEFIDLDDSSGVPDQSSTAFCLGLGMLCLFWFQRRQAIRQ